MRKRPENSWRQASSQGIGRGVWRKDRIKLTKNGREAGMERGLSGLGYHRFATTACDVTISVWASRPSPFTLAFDNSALTPVAIFAESTLYRDVVRARFESFSSECLGVVADAQTDGSSKMLYILCAAGGLRIGEALGIDIKNVSPDCSTIKICQKAWRGKIQDFLKTKNGKREIDLHSSVAAMLKDFIGERDQGLLFQSRKGKPLSQSNILRRSLHPILVALGQPKCGAHAFRRFRDTYLKNYTSTPLGLIKYWLGWAEEDMSGVYDKIRQDVGFRKEVAEKAGLGFELPVEKPVVGPNGPKIKNEVVLEMAASV